MTKKIIFALIYLVLILPPATIGAYAAEERSQECRTVRVGYFDFAGYHDLGEDGEKSGYGYEYLQELKKYANWEYEYIYGTYEDCLELLKAGKIDLLTSVSYSEERDKSFDYSEVQMGVKSFILTVKNSNDKYIPGEYKALEGIHAGMLSGNTSNAKFEDFSKKHGFSYTYDDSYSDVGELCQALQDGKVEAIVTSNLRKTKDERVVAEFAPSPYYAIVKSGDRQLLYELNTAMEKLNIVSPTYQPLLYQKYYGGGTGGGIALSAEEVAYIKDNPELSVLIAPAMRPMVVSDGAEDLGIVTEIIKKALEPVGIKPDFVICGSEEEYRVQKENLKKYPVMGMVEENLYKAESGGIRLTSPYLALNYSVIARTGREPDEISVAAVPNTGVTRDCVEKRYEPGQIKYYGSDEECVEAVLAGEASRAIVNSYIAEYIIEEDVRDRLTSYAVMGFSTNLGMSVNNGGDYLLFSILNKCVNALSQDDVRSIVMGSTIYKDRGASLTEYIYIHPFRVMLLVIIFFAVVIFVIIIAGRQKRMEKVRQAFEETSHFARIAMEATGEITEVNLKDRMMTSYSFSGKNLIKEGRNMSGAYFDKKLGADMICQENMAEYDEMFSKANLLAVAGKDVKKTCTLKIKTVDGNYCWNLLTLQGIESDKLHPNNVMIFRQDIDALKRKEEMHASQLTDALNTAMAASEAKGAFMSRMSHEIRTPLNAVIGYMAIAKNNEKNINKMNDCMSKAEKAAKHLLSIINDVLDMSSIESGKLKISKTSFDLRELVSDAASVFYAQAKAKNVKFEVVTRGVTEDFLMGDKLRVNQVLFNLLSNAIKFTPQEGKICFTIEQGAVRDNTVFMRFIVSDNGIGMKKEFKDRLFMPFEQQDASIAQDYGGTGLGLSITKNLITMMSGSIKVESKPGEGATFDVELPFGRDEGYVKYGGEAQSFLNVKALIVDDEQSTCEYMQILMDRCGIKSEYVLGGRDAVEKISFAHNFGHAFDMCLMDWKMPDMNGVETVKKIRECVGKDMPIIVVTAYDFSEVEESARAAGVDRFISKPLFQSTMFDLLVDTYGKRHVAHVEKAMDSDFKGKKLLLVEDNEMNREIAVEILKGYGFEVDCAENGKEALEAFERSEEGEYAAILMDVQMPVMGGYEATEAIRSSLHPMSKIIPIIAMTANAFREDIALSYSAGMNDHISKPIDVDQMMTIIKKHLK